MLQATAAARMICGVLVGSGVGVGARKWSWGWLWVDSGIRVFKVLTEGLPKPQPIGEGTFGFCSSALMSLVSGFAATT
jgi:hypothetical protein